MEKKIEMGMEKRMKRETSITSKTSKTSKPKTSKISNISNTSNISNKSDERLSVRKKKVKLMPFPPRLEPKPLPPRFKPLPPHLKPKPLHSFFPLHSLLPLPPHPLKPLPPHLLLKRSSSNSPTLKGGNLSQSVRRVRRVRRVLPVRPVLSVRPVLQPSNRPLKSVGKASPPHVKVRSNSRSSSLKKGHHLLIPEKRSSFTIIKN